MGSTFAWSALAAGPTRGRRSALAAIFAAVLAASVAQPASGQAGVDGQPPAGARTEAPKADGPLKLRIVGGLANINQYERHEAPFWTSTLPRLTGGRVTAEIVPFDQAGLRGQEMLRLVQLGAVPFGTALLSLINAHDPELGAIDLPGLNPDMPTLRRHLAAFRPHLEARLRERWGTELLAVYVYPAQVTFCARPFSRLLDLAGRRIRSSSAAQSDFVEALGASPVQTPFADIVSSVRSGAIECAITGTMSGNSIGLHEVTTHIHALAINWGLGVFVANGAAWAALPHDTRTLLRAELEKLEQAIWADSERETGEGIACNVGAASCRTGRKGRMVAVRETDDDVRRRRELFVSVVLHRWELRCGPRCDEVWNSTLGPASGITASSFRK